MANAEDVEVVKQGAEAIRRWREQHPDTRLDLRDAELAGTDRYEANLDEAMLTKANLHGAYMTRARLRKATCHEADLRAYLGDANLSGAYFVRANLGGAILIGANLRGAYLHGANIERAELWGANLSRADLTSVNLYRTSLQEVRGAEKAYALETLKFTPINDPQAPAVGADAVSFETCRRRWPEHWLDWERLQVVGRLPLFGIPYTALILIPIVFYGLVLYNGKIDLVRAWAKQAVTSPNHPLHRLAPVILERLHR